ncbi:MAG: DUF4097 domain-containing protein [Acidobacteria bacterium]|nr:DUF4097 domain-containing protein [Acidobacteriota bacterium]
MKNSFVGPVVLIGVGVLFLANNLRPDLSPWRLLADYWPYLLIIWGVIRLVEIAWLASRNQPLPKRGVSGGEWGLIIFVSLFASGMWLAYDAREKIRSGRVNLRGLQIFGESFEYPVSASVTAGKTPRIIVENRRGNVRLVGGDSDKVTVSGHNTVMGLDRTEADRINERMKLEVTVQGDQVVIRTNQERVNTDNRVDSDLEVQIPKGASVECRGTRGDFDVSHITGNYEVTSENAGVRGQDIGGNVRVDIRRSDIVRLLKVKGNVDVKASRGEDIELDEVTGQAIVAGQFTGSVDFRRVEKLLRFESEATNLSVEKLKGRARLSDGDLEVEDILGPMKLRSRSKDVRVSGFATPVEIDLNRGDIELSPGSSTLSTIIAKTSSGAVTMHLPENAKYDIEAKTRRGEVENLFGNALDRVEEDRGGVIRGKNGGPRIVLETERGTMTVTRGGTMSSRMDLKYPPAAPSAPVAPAAPKPPTVVER